MKVDVIEDAIDHISEQGLEASTAKLIPPGSLLMVVRGMILAHSFPTAVTAKSVTINQDMKALVPFCPEMFSYLALMAKGISRGVLGLVKRSTHGTCKLLTDELFEYPVAIPPLAEQQRIVAKVDELMALCDRLEAAQAEREARRDRLVAASLARVSQPAADAGSDARAAGFHLDHFARLTTRPEHVKHLRQSILNLAVRGRLVPQDPKDPPLSPLLDRMAAAKAAHLTRSGSVKNVSTPTPLSSSKAPWLIPASWGWFSFGDVAISRDAERIPVSKEQRSGLAKTYDYYGASGVIDKIDRYLFDKPLLLIGEDGANLINRSTPIAFIARGEYWVNNHAHVLDGESEDLLRFLELHINAIDLKPFVTGTAQPKMNQAKMNSIPIALPPLAEQRRIVAKVDELMALCDQLEASLAAAATDRARLLESLLHEALAPAA
jgi:type I restriction enzyme S subunit